MDTHLFKHQQLIKEIVEVFNTIQSFNDLMEIPYSEDLGFGFEYDEYLYREFIGKNNKVRWLLV